MYWKNLSVYHTILSNILASLMEAVGPQCPDPSATYLVGVCPAKAPVYARQLALAVASRTRLRLSSPWHDHVMTSPRLGGETPEPPASALGVGFLLLLRPLFLNPQEAYAHKMPQRSPSAGARIALRGRVDNTSTAEDRQRKEWKDLDDLREADVQIEHQSPKLR